MKTIEQPAVLRATRCFARPGDFTSMIDMVHPETGRSICYDQTLDQIRERYPDAVVIEYSDWCNGGAEHQRATMKAATWIECTEARYWEMLEVLPPERMERGAFLVGEPADHCRITGAPRFAMFRKNRAGQHLELSEPVTAKEFSALVARDFIF